MEDFNTHDDSQGDAMRADFERFKREAVEDVEAIVQRAWAAGETYAKTIPPEMRLDLQKRLDGCAFEFADYVHDMHGAGFAVCDYATAFLLDLKPEHGCWNALFSGYRIGPEECNDSLWVMSFILAIAVPDAKEGFLNNLKSGIDRRMQGPS